MHVQLQTSWLNSLSLDVTWNGNCVVQVKHFSNRLCTTVLAQWSLIVEVCLLHINHALPLNCTMWQHLMPIVMMVCVLECFVKLQMNDSFLCWLLCRLAEVYAKTSPQVKRPTLKQIEPYVSWQDAVSGPVRFKCSAVGCSMLINKGASWVDTVCLDWRFSACVDYHDCHFLIHCRMLACNTLLTSRRYRSWLQNFYQLKLDLRDDLWPYLGVNITYSLITSFPSHTYSVLLLHSICPVSKDLWHSGDLSWSESAHPEVPPGSRDLGIESN